MGACQANPAVIELEVETFAMIENIIESDVVLACQYIDSYLKKNISPTQAATLNALKTSAVKKALGAAPPAPPAVPA